MPLFTQRPSHKSHEIPPASDRAPVAVPEVRISDCAEAPLSPRRRKRLAIVPPPADVSLLLGCLGEGNSPASESTSPSPRQPRSSSSSSSVSQAELRQRRSSTRSLELLRDAQQRGQIPNWDDLPPSPLYIETQLVRSLMQWGTEAGAAQEKAQRTRIAQELVRISRDGAERLIIDDAPSLPELPPGLGQLVTLKHVVFVGLGLKAVPDLSGLVNLQSLVIKDCPKLRTLPLGLSKRETTLSVELENLPSLVETPRRMAGAKVSRKGAPWDKPVKVDRRTGARPRHQWL